MLMRPAFMLSLFAALLVSLFTATVSLAEEGYRIRPGDILRIEVLEDAGLNRSVLVAPDGRLSMPLAGTVQAGGLTVDQVQADMAKRMAGSFAAPPNVYISLERLAERAPAGSGGAAAAASIDVYVMGEVARPGKLAVKPGTSVLQLFAEMGGFSKFAATKRIQLRRSEDGVEKVYLLNYRAIEAGTGTGGSTTVRDGDVFVVPQRKLFE